MLENVSSAGASHARTPAEGVFLFRGGAPPWPVTPVRPVSRIRRSRGDRDLASSDRHRLLVSERQARLCFGVIIKLRHGRSVATDSRSTGRPGGWWRRNRCATIATISRISIIAIGRRSRVSLGVRTLENVSTGKGVARDPLIETEVSRYRCFEKLRKF